MLLRCSWCVSTSSTRTITDVRLLHPCCSTTTIAPSQYSIAPDDFNHDAGVKPNASHNHAAAPCTSGTEIPDYGTAASNDS
jgi:hypothetical protein